MAPQTVTFFDDAIFSEWLMVGFLMIFDVFKKVKSFNQFLFWWVGVFSMSTKPKWTESFRSLFLNSKIKRDLLQQCLSNVTWSSAHWYDTWPICSKTRALETLKTLKRRIFFETDMSDSHCGFAIFCLIQRLSFPTNSGSMIRMPFV